MVSISILLGFRCSRRLRTLLAIACLSSSDSLESNREKAASLPDRKVWWCSLFSRVAVEITGLSFLTFLSHWIEVRRFRAALRENSYIYRVTHPSRHPLISLCARIQKN
jgi:hypothetical protein